MTGCRTSTGPGLHVAVRAEPPQGYKPPLMSPSGEVAGTGGGYGAAVEPAAPPAQATPPEPGIELIDYRRLGGIIVWIEPVGGASAATPAAARPPLGAQVDLRSQQRANFEHVHLASVGGRVSFDPASATPGEFVLRTRDGDVPDVLDLPSPPVFVPRRPGHVEVVPAYPGDGSDGGGGEPVAHVFVAPTPWARKVRNGERVTFAPLPPGRYRVTTWHPVLPGGTQEVDVTPGGLVKLTASVGVSPLPKPGR